MRPLVSARIDSAALRHNLQVVRERAPRSRIMAVIKANAYGHGLIAVARALPHADAFAVARIEEGLFLRAAGISQSIVLLEGVFDAEQMRIAARERFELLIHSEAQVALFDALPANPASAGDRFTVWLKLDTGMNRLGLKDAAFLATHQRLSRMSWVDQPVKLFSHMANADTPDHPGTLAQLARFDALTQSLSGERSLANSATLLGFSAAQRDWIRPGLLLYGASPFAATTGADYGLRPVMTLRSTVIAVKQLQVGEAVGYGSAWRAARPTRLAIAAVGYGDGYPRSVGNGAPVLVNGQRAGMAGRVSMDMIAIDVSELSAVEIGGEVTLWGQGLPVEEIATWAGTIPYELLCGISQRVAVELV